MTYRLDEQTREILRTHDLNPTLLVPVSRRGLVVFINREDLNRVLDRTSKQITVYRISHGGRVDVIKENPRNLYRIRHERNYY